MYDPTPPRGGMLRVMTAIRFIALLALPAATVILSEPRSGESKDLDPRQTSRSFDSAAFGRSAQNDSGTQPPSGSDLYQRCVACHQATGEGVPGAFPPLAGSEFVTGKPDVPIRILLHGLTGPVKVKGTDYNGVMVAYGTGQPMTDAEAAAVLTHIRTNFGNKATPITAKQVAAVRTATKSRTTPWTEAELRPLLK
jgi:mono/diheme cytochrome c family protein